MKNILVPVDFTKTSFSAYYYANQLANLTGARITLMHVISGSFNTSDTMFLDSLDSAYQAAKKRLKYFAKEYAGEQGYELHNVKVKYDVRFGVPGFAVVDYLKDVDVDCVVMGTRDKHNIIERFLGTTSSIIAKLSSRPLILVHENTRFKKPEKVVFAVDTQTDFDESIDEYLKFNEFFKASTDFVHVSSEKQNIADTSDQILKEMFENKDPDFAFQIKNVHASDAVQGLIDYCIFEEADLLVMVHRKKSLFAEFFSKSFSLKTAEGIHLPVMILNENPPEEE
ncbi:MAG: universal stress protein [Saprospiraceae bacterium]|nr:universal stress protein [Saprospiraceae bacterium]